MATILHGHTDHPSVHHHRSPAVQFGQGVLGAACIAAGLMLSATLLLSPIGFSTLSTEIWSSYEEGFYAATGLASLALIALSALLTWVLVLRRSDVLR